MFVSRSNNSNSCKSYSWLTYLLVIAVLGIVIFGARHKIKDGLHEFVSIDKSKIEQIVQDYILQNPKVIISSLQEMQKREYEEKMQQAKMKIHDSQDELQGKNHEIVPFIGNKDGDVTVITFLDYRCGYCKRSNSDLKELVKRDSKVKVIFKELPVLGPQSQQLAKMALAVYLIDEKKYPDFHNALMEATEINDKTLEAIAKQFNLDYAAINAKLSDAKIQKELDSVAELAGQLGVRGTPAFVIGEELIPGAIDLTNLTNKIQEYRKNKVTNDEKK